MPSAPRAPRGIDFDPVKVGRPCIQPRALEVIDAIHHHVQWRRMTGGCVAYQAGAAELTTPTRLGTATIPNHGFYHLVSPNARFIRVTVWTAGATGSGAADPYLTCTTTTDGTGAVFARVPHAGAPGASFTDDAVQVHSATVEVTPGSLEAVTLVQNSTSDAVRIISAVVREVPIGTVDPDGADALYINPDNFEPGTHIIDTENDDLPLGMNLLRRQGKKLLHSDNVEARITDVGVANRRDILSWSTGAPPADPANWNIYPSVNLPETSGVAVTCYVLGRATAGVGTLRFAFSGGNIDVGAIGPLGIYTGTGSIAKVSDTLSKQGYISVAGTFYHYASFVVEDREAA